MVKSTKFPEDERTFETRLKFIKEIFTNKYEPYQIMPHSIHHKLDKCYEAYIKEIHKSVWLLEDKDPMAILKKID